MMVGTICKLMLPVLNMNMILLRGIFQKTYLKSLIFSVTLYLLKGEKHLNFDRLNRANRYPNY